MLVGGINLSCDSGDKFFLLYDRKKRSPSYSIYARIAFDDNYKKSDFDCILSMEWVGEWALSL